MNRHKCLDAYNWFDHQTQMTELNYDRAQAFMRNAKSQTGAAYQHICHCLNAGYMEALVNYWLDSVWELAKKRRQRAPPSVPAPLATPTPFSRRRSRLEARKRPEWRVGNNGSYSR